MTHTADIVVAGAGHNSLVCAAYLARAGREVLVLDARPVPGGGAATEELLGPGYLIDSCSTGHTLIQANPLLERDELGLLGEQGLEYLEPDPVAHVAFPDAEQVTMWLDVDRTVEEIARFSRADAAQYRRLLASYDAVKGEFSRNRFTPAGTTPPLSAALDPVWQRRNALSAWEVVRHEFESRHVQAFLLWQAFQTLVSVDLPGSGALAYSIVYGRQQRSWTLPRGGSGRLTDALVRVIEGEGGTVVCDRLVTRLVLEGGRCAGVETSDGERWLARDAVVSTIHVKQLLDMAPSEVWPESFRYGVETFDVGIPAFVVYLAASAPPSFPTPRGPCSAVSAGLAAWPEELVRACREFRDGRFVAETPWLLVATPTLADPGRAPAGHHTVKLITPQGSAPPPGFADWPEARESYAATLLGSLRRFAPDFTDDVILASLVRSPPDIEAANPHMIGGTFHGGDRGIPFSGALRPAPGWAQHRMPIPGLYQTGGTTHPGGSITGGPGRNAAIVVLEDSEPASRRCFRVPDARVQAAIDHWAPRFVQAGVDYNDFVRTTARIEHWEQWLDAWSALGDEHAELAQEAEVGGRHRTAGEAWLRAAVAYHFGKFVWVLDAARARAAAERAIAALTEGHRLLRTGVERIETPLAIGNLRLPTNQRPPLILLLPGLDSTKEEFFRLEELFLARGMATLAMDGPGQGETGYTVPIRHDYEVGVSAALDALAGRSDVDLDRVGALGVSLGGYYAPRAGAFEPRLKAVVGISGTYDFGEIWDSLPPLTRETFTVKSGARDEEEGRAFAGRLSLAGVLDRLDRPALFVTGKLDRLVPWQQTERGALESPNGTFVLFEDGNHVCANIPYKVRPLAADWLREQLG